MPAPAATIEPRFFSIAGAAVYSSLGELTIRKLLATGRLRKVQPPGSKRVLVDRVQLDAVLRRGAAAMAAQAKVEADVSAEAAQPDEAAAATA